MSLRQLLQANGDGTILPMDDAMSGQTPSSESEKRLHRSTSFQQLTLKKRGQMSSLLSSNLSSEAGQAKSR